MLQHIDLSHVITDGLITARGLPAPIICDFLSREASAEFYDPGTSFHIGKIEMVANTGTYIDAPFHRYEQGMDIAELPLKTLVGRPALRVKVPTNIRAITAEPFAALDVHDRVVLIETSWSRHWNTPAYSEGHPFLTEAAAVALRDGGATIVGIDSCNMDDMTDGRRPAHTTLLGADIPIVEHLCNLEALPDAGFTFTAVPAKVRAMGTFPVRAFASIPASP